MYLMLTQIIISYHLKATTIRVFVLTKNSCIFVFMIWLFSNKRFLQYIFIFCLSVTMLQGQQLSNFSQYRELSSVINPAMLSDDFFTSEQNVNIGATYRNQWLPVKNHPITRVLHGDYFNSQSSGLGLLAGGFLMDDRTGPTGTTGIYGKIGAVSSSEPYYGGFSVALQFGIVQYSVDFSKLSFRDKREMNITDDKNKIYPDLGFGVFYYNNLQGRFSGDYIYGGFSIPQVFGLSVKFEEGDDNFQIKRTQHAFANVGWYRFINDHQYFHFSSFAKFIPNAPINVDINTQFHINDVLWVGVGAGINGNTHLEIGVRLADKLKLGYGFDHSFSKLGPTLGQTHELNLTFSYQKY